METAHKLTSTQIHLSPAPAAPSAPWDHWISQGIHDYLGVIHNMDEPDRLVEYLTNIHSWCVPIMQYHINNWLFDRALLRAVQKIATIIINSATKETAENAITKWFLNTYLTRKGQLKRKQTFRKPLKKHKPLSPRLKRNPRLPYKQMNMPWSRWTTRSLCKSITMKLIYQT